jgi:hypothetical protein
MCNYERYHRVSVLRKDGSRYDTSFFACSQCSVMFLNPEQWNGCPSAQPGVSIAAPPDVVTPIRRRRR